MDNIKEWTSLPIPELLMMASSREQWKRISAESSGVLPNNPIGQGTNINQPEIKTHLAQSLLDQLNRVSHKLTCPVISSGCCSSWSTRKAWSPIPVLARRRCWRFLTVFRSVWCHRNKVTVNSLALGLGQLHGQISSETFCTTLVDFSCSNLHKYERRHDMGESNKQDG